MEGIDPFHFNSKLLPKLGKQLVSIREDRRDEIDRIANVFGDPYELANFYIEPNCQHFNPADSDEDDAINIIQANTFLMLSKFLSGSMQIRDGRSQLFVLGDSGMGKSSLLVMLKLMHLTSFWPQRTNCMLLKIGDDTIETVAKVKDKRNTILLLDALDEDYIAWTSGIELRLQDLLENTRRFSRVIITCRTQFFPATLTDPLEKRGFVELVTFRCPLIYLSLFDAYQIDQYLKKRFPRSRKKIERAKEIICMMKSLKFRPLLLAHIEDLLDSDNEKWDESSVYDSLINTWLLREARKNKNILGETAVGREVLRRSCALLAGLMYKDGLLKIDKERMKKEQSTQRELAGIELIEIGGRSLLNRTSVGEYRFSHFSVQEYLACQSLCSETETRTPGKSAADTAVRTTDQFRVFLTQRIQSNPRSTEDGHPNTSWMNLSFLNLDEIDFMRLRLAGADLSAASLRYANLTRADCRWVRFSSADLRGADLSGVNFQYADMRGVTLKDAQISGADFSGCDLSGVGIDLEVFKKSQCSHNQDTIWPENISWYLKQSGLVL